MPKVQRVPRELLAAFAIVGEQPPSELLPDYRATLESLNFILTELPLESESATSAAAVAGTTVAVQVPAREVWFVESVEALITASADDNEIMARWSGGELESKVYIDGQTKVPGSQNQQAGWSTAKSGTYPLVVKAGQLLQARLVNTDAAGAQNLFCFVTLRRVRV